MSGKDCSNKASTIRPPNEFINMKTFRVICLAGAVFGAVCAAEAALDTAKIDAITGLKGKFNAQEGVYKVSFPRDDVKVSVAGWQMPPFMGLGTWAAFQGTN